MRPSLAWAWVLAAAAVLLAGFALLLNALAGDHGDPWWQHVAGAVVVLGCASIGLLIAVRRGSHPIGWLLLVDGALLATFGLAQPYAQYALLEDPGALPGPEWAVLWDQSAWPLLFAVIVAIAFVFPDGRLPSPRWRWVAGGSVAAFSLLVLMFAVAPEPFERLMGASSGPCRSFRRRWVRCLCRPSWVRSRALPPPPGPCGCDSARRWASSACS